MLFVISGRVAAQVAACLSVLGLALLAACEHKAPPPAPPPPKVSVVTVRAQAVPITTELPGRVAGFRYADVRPQVNGIILRRLFVEGSEVKAGQQLYQIDPAPYQATYDSAVAANASARALWERYKPLAEANAVSKQDYDNAEASHLQAQAAVETARINLIYTRVLSPITGRIGRSLITEGALVTANQATALATVQQLDPVYVDVTQPTTTLLRLEMRGHGIIVILLADGIRFGQRFVAFRECPGGSIRRNGAVVTGFVGRRINLVELLPCLDIAPLDEEPLQNDAVDLWSHVGGTVARHASGKLGGNQHRLSFYGDHRDFRGWRVRRRGLVPAAGEQHHGQNGRSDRDTRTTDS